MIGNLVKFYYLRRKGLCMIELPYTIDSVGLIQEFLKETRERISNGIEITFTAKANSELQELMLEYDIMVADIEYAILTLQKRIIIGE